MEYGMEPTLSEKVKVQYTGRLINNKVFDSSVGKSDGLIIDLNQIIEGWKESLFLIPVGSKWKLYIPSNLVYGENGTGKIPPGSTLIFEIELLKILH